jgi:hypothetical protein
MYVHRKVWRTKTGVKRIRFLIRPAKNIGGVILLLALSSAADLTSNFQVIFPSLCVAVVCYEAHHCSTMAKTRIGVVFRESVAGVKSHNQSADLVALTERYHAFVKKLHVLINSLQQHHAVMMQIDKTRTQVRR